MPVDSITDPASDRALQTRGADWEAFRAGITGMTPWLLSIVPFGLVIGLTSADTGLSLLSTLALAVGVFSGSAQLAVLEVISAGTGVIAAIVGVTVLNLRLVLYGSSIGANWRGASPKVRVPAAAFLIDPTFFVGSTGYREGRGHAYYFGGVLALALAWPAAITIGFSAGAGIPPALQLEHCVTFFLLAELVRDARTRPAFAAAGVSAVIAIAGNGLPLGGGLLTGMIAGMVVAVRLDRSPSQAVE